MMNMEELELLKSLRKDSETLANARTLVDDIKAKIDTKTELTDIEVDLLILSSVIHNRSLTESTLSENHKRLEAKQ